ncbi:MAG: SCO family protein [Anaerolineae bacterium]|nr:MAG: SCO family protein [Anaerolineae bacterium]
MIDRKVFWVGVVVLALAVLVAVVPWKRTYEFRGALIDPPQPAPQIGLTDVNGRLFDLRAWRGDIVLLTFGYTSCPDVCPTTLADLKRLRAELDADQAARVQVVFITVDPQRDTPERVQEYVSFFDPTFIGLSGSEEDLAPVWQAYGVFREVGERNAEGGYAVNHSARIYLVDPDGNLRLTYSFGTDPQDILRDVRYLLSAEAG